MVHYLVSGKDRRELKGRLSKLKYQLKMVPFYEDISNVYGSHYNVDIEKLKSDIAEIEHTLQIKIHKLDQWKI